jgi:hypothetical protein
MESGKLDEELARMNKSGWCRGEPQPTSYGPDLYAHVFGEEASALIALDE